ncbi:MAG: murein L,D-transpeptidase YafK [Bacteroidia bacterium]|jgi:murein L,D-transpeptidase YafK
MNLQKVGVLALATVLILLVFGFAAGMSSTFIDQQINHVRVKEAFNEKEIDLRTKLAMRGVDHSNFEIFVRIFKMEEVVEVWARTRGTKTFTQIENYPFCTSIGTVGPKREQGDKQIPEGFYNVSQFNPTSDFHLSLQVSYPNKSDSILGSKNNLGGLIFIHGGCVTIGCVPITNDKIKALYVLSVLAKDNGQANIPIHIYPTRLNYANFKLLSELPDKEHLVDFWQNLKTCYTWFEEHGSLPYIGVGNEGEYLYYYPN